MWAERCTACRDVHLISKPVAYIADFFVRTPLTFLGTTCELSEARCFTHACGCLAHVWELDLEHQLSPPAVISCSA